MQNVKLARLLTLEAVNLLTTSLKMVMLEENLKGFKLTSRFERKIVMCKLCYRKCRQKFMLDGIIYFKTHTNIHTHSL